MSSATHLTGRTALVTGAGRGIGAAVAGELAALGAQVILVGRNADRLRDVRQRIETDGGSATVVAADVRTSEWLQQLTAANDSIDILVHGAAAFAGYGPLEERSDAEIQEVIDTNLVAALRISAALLPAMKQNDFGRLLFLGSRVASLGAATQVAYASAKGGLEALVRSLTAETAHANIAAHLLEVGLIDTERTREAMSDAAREKLAAASPAGRIGTTADVTAAIRYLLSPEADYLRGITLRIDGGMGLGIG